MLGKFLSSCTTGGYSKRAQLHEVSSDYSCNVKRMQTDRVVIGQKGNEVKTPKVY
jgi:hypothetical protein